MTSISAPVFGVARTMPDTMLVLGKDGSIVECLPGSDEANAGRLDASDECVRDYLPADIADHWLAAQQRVIETGIFEVYEYDLERFDGSRVYYQARFIPYVDDKVLVVATEYTARKKAEEEAYRLAYFDTLTGLPNRQFFLKHLEHMLRKAEKEKKSVAVLFVDLDNFKRINDNLGHTFGDGVLQAIAERLSGCIRKEEPSAKGAAGPIGIARLGGDEFVCAISGFTDEEVPNSVAERIRETLREPVEFRGQQFVVTPSVGVAVYPDDGDNVDDLLKNADLAMYQAKGGGRNAVRFYSGTMSVRSMRRLQLEGDLRRAIENDALELYYQPKIDLGNARMVGVEALLRWRDEDGDFIPPDHFIPAAEESGLIIPLGDWVLKAVCKQIRSWKTSLDLDIQVAVNISSQQFYQSDLRNTIMRTLFESSVRPNLLQLELTESILMREVQDTIDTLNALKDAGVGLAIDDFGTGYSSLSYLKRFPLDFLKIDRSFVNELQPGNDDAAICAAIIAMAHQLGLSVVAEGIETAEQLKFLRDHGCEYGQGYLLAKPMPADKLERGISRGRDARRDSISG